MSVDRRTDAGEFYPGGKVISTRPVAPGGKVDDAVTRTSSNGVKSSGIWSAIWGALTALPGVSSLYDWCVEQLAGKVPTSRTVNGKALTADVTLTKSDVGLGNVDNTSDANKPVSTAMREALAGKASTADATLTPIYSGWAILRDGVDITAQVQQPYWEDDPDGAHFNQWVITGSYIQGDNGVSTSLSPRDTISLSWVGVDSALAQHQYTATRSILGCQLGSQTDKPLASEAEAVALRTGKQDALTAQQLASIAAVPDKANRAANPTAGNLAALDAQGNPTDSGLSKDEVESLLLAKYYPDGSVKSAAELTSGIKYDFNDNDRTASALPFCDTGTGEDNHNLTGRVVIPSFVDRQGNPSLFDDGTKYKVVEVMDDRMDGYGNSGLTDIIAPTTVTRVGVNSFCGCEDLVSASFPGVTTVDLYAFYECSSLESIALPLAATIGDESFVGCSALASVAFPSATSIGDAVFTACSSLASATLPAVTSIGEQSFADCSALAYVVVPSVRSIGRNAFARCSSLASVEIPSATTVDYAAFTGCRSITAVSAPTATSVGEQAFKDCSALTSIELPSATGIGDNAFWACSSLKSAALPSATTIGVAAFANCEALASIDIPSATAIGDSAFYHCLALDVLDFGDTPRSSVPTLGSGAFQDVPTTCKIIVPDAQYSAWVVASGWSDLVTAGYKFLRHSEWEYARKYDLRYDLVTKSITSMDEVSLDDHAMNAVAVSSSHESLTINFPPATSGKVREFGLRITVSSGVSAPEIFLSAGEDANYETSDGEAPVVADGGTDGSTTILYFTETAADVFLVKAETVKTILVEG